MNTSSQIDIRDIGPITEFSFELSGAGLYQLEGEPASGKSTVLRCLESVIVGKSLELSVRDGALDGSVQALGRLIPVGGRKRPKGELEGVATLEQDSYSLVDVSDPPVKNPVAADAHRIRAFAALTRAAVSIPDFYELFGGQKRFESIVDVSKLKPDGDPVLLTSRIKRDVDAVARDKESRAEQEQIQSRTCQVAIESVEDIDAPSDSKELANKAMEAASFHTLLRNNATTARKAIEEQKAAKAKFGEMMLAYRGTSVAKADEEHLAAQRYVKLCDEKIDEIRVQLRNAEEMRRQSLVQLDHRAKDKAAAIEHEKMVATLGEMVEREIEPPPSDEDIARAAAEVESARVAQEQGVRVRDARAARDRQQAHLDASTVALKEAQRLRKLASDCWGVLADKVHLKHLRIIETNDGGRLCVDHPKRPGKPTLLSELSGSEMISAIVEELAPIISSDGQMGFMPLPQEIFQELSPFERQRIHEQAVEKRIIVFGAQVGEGALRVRKYALTPELASVENQS